jgi:hypothetical protein
MPAGKRGPQASGPINFMFIPRINMKVAAHEICHVGALYLPDVNIV